ncbi:MAG: hypothetical protein LCH96_14200 [Actinobacteria bacterium]|nr:hypothetical protein [Actinomycetota bacterium]
MKLVHTIVAGAAVLATGGVLFAATAAADPSSPAPAPSTTTAADRARTGRGAGVAWFYGALTDVQRRCLADAGLQRPSGTLTAEQRAELSRQVQTTLAGCGVTVTARLADRPGLGVVWTSLTPAQQQCLARTELTRPLGRLTDAQRAAVKQSVRDAVAACR